MSNRHRLPAWGLESGREGKTGATLFLLNGASRWQDAREAYGRASSSKYSNIKLAAGDTVKVLMPGGGGYGDPLTRSRELVREDVADGYVSEAEASRLYGHTPQGTG
jgi:N-methylhydantoinase B/oxoprolinase/acetone carboxylase alpha subunit